MTPPLVIALMAGICLGVAGCRRPADHPGGPSAATDQTIQYFRASHGFDGGLLEMVDLSKRDGFDAVRTMADVARFASEVPGAVGFTAHPEFENGTRYASAVLWYTGLSHTRSSWALFLFDANEAKKLPGDAPRAEAVAAAKAKVASKMDEARDLIAAAGPSGVKLGGDPIEQKALALAVLSLGGQFGHTGEYGARRCAGCRTVARGNPSRCEVGLEWKTHWNCCGSTNETGHCTYWQAIKAQDEASPDEG